MKCSISVVLPIPASPATQTIWRLPAASRFPRAAKVGQRLGPTDERAVVVRLDNRCVALHRRARDVAGLGDEAVSTPRHGLDEPWLASIVIEGRAQFADGRAQHGVAHELVAPDLVQKLVRGEQRSALAHKGAQHGEWRRGE
jgi:hypothetical protein